MANITSLRKAMTVYWLLLVYVVAALVWWFITLEKQNKKIYINELNLAYNQQTNTADTVVKAKLLSAKKRRTAKHIAEGLVFLLVIAVGAFYIYRIVRRRLQLGQQQQNFVMAVTHELKTPIAIAKLNTETMQRRSLDEAMQQKLLQNSITELNRLNELVSNILVVSQLETNEYKLSKEPIQLSQIAESTVQELVQQLPGIKIKYTAESSSSTIGDPLLIKLVINNLVTNAYKYGGTQNEILVSTFEKDNHMCLSVADNGEGIAPTEKQKIFEKFYRSTNEQTRSTKGTGLGLYLCKKIVKDHGGHITVADNHPTGSIFTIKLKINKYHE